MSCGSILLFLTAIAIPILVMYPVVTFHAIMLLDFFTPFKAFDSPLVAQYHQHLVSQLQDRPEIPLLELPLEEATKESLRIASRDYTFPVVIRGENSPV